MGSGGLRVDEKGHLQSVGTTHKVGPFSDTDEALVNGNHGAVASSIPSDTSDHVVCAVVASVSVETFHIIQDSSLTTIASSSHPQHWLASHSPSSTCTSALSRKGLSLYPPHEAHDTRYSHRHDLLDPILTNILRQTAQMFQMTLSVRDTHHPVHKVDCSAATRVVPSILRSYFVSARHALGIGEVLDCLQHTHQEGRGNRGGYGYRICVPTRWP